MDIANTLKEFRRDNELEQEDLAKLLDTTQQTVSNWESGTMPRSAALNRINHLLKTYRKGEDQTPWVAPTYHPSITEIHEIPVDRRLQRQRLDALRNAAAHGAPVSEYDHRIPRPEKIKPILEDGPAAFENDFMHHLADILPVTRPFEIDARVDYPGLRLRADYLSSKVCAEIKINVRTMTPFPLEIGIYQLSTFRRVFERKGEPRTVYALFLVAKDPDHRPRLLNRILASAALHDVQVFVVHTPEECAQLIEELETGKYEDYEDYL